MIKVDSAYVIPFSTTVAGEPTAADSTPTAVLWRNGSAEVTSVVIVTTANTGIYHASFTTDEGWAATDRIWLVVSATIATVSYKAVAWDSFDEPDSAATIGAAVWEVLTSTLNTLGSTGRALARLIGLVEDSSGDRLTAKSLEVIERAGGMLALVKAKTDLISAGGVTILSPVAQDGTLNNLVVGDAYQAAAGRAIEITVTDVSAGLQTILQDVGASVHLGFLRYGKSRQNPDFRRYEFAGTIVSVGASTVVRFELTTAQTLGIVPSKYDYDIEFRQNANFVTSVANAKGKPMEWLESATELA